LRLGSPRSDALLDEFERDLATPEGSDKLARPAPQSS
jgi:hypothetical protein